MSKKNKKKNKSIFKQLAEVLEEENYDPVDFAEDETKEKKQKKEKKMKKIFEEADNASPEQMVAMAADKHVHESGKAKEEEKEEKTLEKNKVSKEAVDKAVAMLRSVINNKPNLFTHKMPKDLVENNILYYKENGCESNDDKFYYEVLKLIHIFYEGGDEEKEKKIQDKLIHKYITKDMLEILPIEDCKDTILKKAA